MKIFLISFLEQLKNNAVINPKKVKLKKRTKE